MSTDRKTLDGDDDPVVDFALATAPGHLLRLCQQRAVELFVEEVGEDGPTPRQFAILLGVHHDPGTSQTDLVRISGIDRSTLAEIVGRLVERGLLSRRRPEHDQRANALFLTASGQAVLGDAVPGVRRAQERIIAPVPPARRAEIMTALALLSGRPAAEPD